MVSFTPELRRASANDSTDMLAIYNQSIQRGEIAFHNHEVATAELANVLLFGDDRYQTYVAVVEGVVRGWAGFRQWHQRAAYASTLELVVYVAPTHRSRGLGTALVSLVIAAAARANYRTILALSPSDDRVAARLSRSTGFFRAGALGAVFPGTEARHDIVLYQRMLLDAGQ